MKITVVRVVKDGKVGYLNGTSIFHANNIVDEPTAAINYALPQNNKRNDQDLARIHITGDQIFARSGLQVDSAEVVEMEVTVQEVSSRPARELFGRHSQ